MVTFNFFDCHLNSDYSVNILDDLVDDFERLILDVKIMLLDLTQILILHNDDACKYNVIINKDEDFVFDFTSAVFALGRLKKLIDPISEVD